MIPTDGDELIEVFEKLRSKSKKLINDLLGLNVAGLDKQFLQIISVFLVTEDTDDSTQEQLVSTGLLVEYLRYLKHMLA